METYRTIRLRLEPDRSISELLAQTVEMYTWSFNQACRFGWVNNITNGVALHNATYHTHRQLTGLPAQLTCSARVKATEALKGAKSLQKNGKKASCPKSASCAIRYDARSFRAWFERRELSILTICGRIRLRFRLPACYFEYSRWDTAGADLIRDRKGHWWVHISVSKTVEEPKLTGQVVGIDLGITKPATDSKGVHYGSDYWKEVEERRFQHKRRLQAKGTKSAKKRLKKLSGKIARFRRDCDHVLSKQIVSMVEPGTILVFEDLSNICFRAKTWKPQRRRLHTWSFHQLQAFTEYKAVARRIAVAYVDPHYTSQQCAACGFRAPANRKTQERFSCRSCGHQANADVNAAMNIRLKYLTNQGCPVNQPIVSSQAQA